MHHEPAVGEDRRKHLDFIQAIVTRMSAASANSKSWLLPVVTATYGYAITENSAGIATLGICASLLFMYLDANYLRQERQFREIYNSVAAGSVLPNFSLKYADLPRDETPAESVGRFRSVLNAWFPRKEIWLSWSIFPFYGSLAFIGFLIACALHLGNHPCP